MRDKVHKNILKLVDKNFPFDDYRPHQKETIAEIVSALISGSKNVVLEGACGSGKSAIAVTIASILKNAYFITAQKTLQRQYLNDFPDIVDLKGRNAYPCWFMMDHLGVNKYCGCDKGQCTRRRKSFLKLCLEKNKCQYANQLIAASEAANVMFNFSSFLFQREMAHRFTGAKSLLVLDECHGTEQQIMNFVEVTIFESDIDETLPELDTVEQYVSFFESIELASKLSEKVEELHRDLEDIIGQPMSDDNKTVKFATNSGARVIDVEDVYSAEDTIELDNEEDQEMADNIDKEIKRYKSALYKYSSLKDYVSNVRCICEYDKKRKSVTIKPLYATYHTPKLLLSGGKNRLLMSATILNAKVFGESIGLDMSKTHSIRVPHTFPVQNRLIHLDYAGPMNYKSRAKSMPKMINKVDKLMSKHQNEKGIIHCQSFKFMQEIIDGVDSGNRGRLLNQKMFNNKDDLLQAHSVSSNTVIIAPAMHEGLDLKDDLSRFQILCKVPYPDSRDNKQLRIRTDENWNYYLWLTALKLVQSCGRSVRSETDYAATYIIDADFDKFFNMADRAGLFPDWFIESLVVD